MKCRAAEHKKRVRFVLYDHVKSESDKTLIHNQKNKKLWGKKKKYKFTSYISNTRKRIMSHEVKNLMQSL